MPLWSHLQTTGGRLLTPLSHCLPQNLLLLIMVRCMACYVCMRVCVHRSCVVFAGSCAAPCCALCGMHAMHHCRCCWSSEVIQRPKIAELRLAPVVAGSQRSCWFVHCGPGCVAGCACAWVCAWFSVPASRCLQGTAVQHALPDCLFAGRVLLVEEVCMDECSCKAPEQSRWQTELCQKVQLQVPALYHNRLL